MKKFFKKLNFKKKSSGSALIMVMIIMVNAILIMSAATAISYRQSKNSGVAKISSIALQASDSGMEWALEKYRPEQHESTENLNTVFGFGSGGTNSLDFENIIIKYYFLDTDKKLLDGDKPVRDLFYIRSVATYTAGGGIKVTRALEATVQGN